MFVKNAIIGHFFVKRQEKQLEDIIFVKMQDKRSPGKSGGHANLTSSRGSEGDNSNLECYRLRFLHFGGSSLISFGNASYLQHWVRMLLSIIDNEYIYNI